jgi:hypothetical protein
VAAEGRHQLQVLILGPGFLRTRSRSSSLPAQRGASHLINRRLSGTDEAFRTPSPSTIVAAARAVLLADGPRLKVKTARAAARAWRSGALDHSFAIPMPDRPARPARPQLLPASRMPKRGKAGSERNRIALLHAAPPQGQGQWRGGKRGRERLLRFRGRSQECLRAADRALRRAGRLLPRSRSRGRLHRPRHPSGGPQ